MHDPRDLIDPARDAVRRLARRKFALDREGFAAAYRRKADAQAKVARLRAEANAAGRERTGGPPSEEEKEAARRLRALIQQAEAEARTAQEEFEALALTVPNIPLDRVPDGDSEKEAVQLRLGGPPLRTPPVPRHHADIGEELGIFDTKTAAQLSGARFSLSKGAGARLERALADFFLDLHTQQQGYTEYAVPYLVNRETMTGTGQLPKFEEDLFATSVAGRELFLIPTAEVPLTNMVAGRTLDARELPAAFTARTPCFRAEAGAYGRDTRGVLRLHQFEKVELVRVCAVQDAAEQLELMVSHAEECLRRLELSYRVIMLPAGDMGFSARVTYDIEVWLPGSDSYREISSVSDCGQFQARRAGIRYRTADGGKSPAVTLNGSALPIGRTVAALLEQGLQADGSVLLPDALVPYTGFRRMRPGGGTTQD